MRVLALIAGVVLLLSILLDAFETVILPRRASRKWRITRMFFVFSWAPWRWIAGFIQGHKKRETWLSFYGPLSLPLLLTVWAAGLCCGFALLYYGIGSPFAATSGELAHNGLRTDFYVSGTTLFTLGLGDVVPTRSVGRGLLVLESGIGLGFLALVIGYLPVLYGAFSRREVEIALLDARAGSPPSGVELLRRHAHPGGEEELAHLMAQWERWAAEILESHISYPVLCYFRSQHDNQSWLSALTCILDASALIIAGLEGHCARQAQLTYAICRHALVDVTQLFGLKSDVHAGKQRMAADGYLVVANELCKSQLRLDRSPAAETRLAEMRSLYEGYACALSAYLRMPIGGWALEASRKDNWRTVARRIGVDKSAQEVNPFLRPAAPEVLEERH